MSSWEEVKRLAADFQKVQLSSTTQKLSERNCIEIVSWLLDKKMIDLIFTNDGKEYLTPDQLMKDISGELYDAGGRINLVDLSKLIRVDLAHINTYLNDFLRVNKDVHHVLGQLIDNNYITKFAEEVNEKLSQQGQISMSDLTIQYDLPAEFLQQVLEKNLGKIIHGKQDKNDPSVIFTESFVARNKAKIKGAIAAITRPTSVAAILGQINMPEKIFFSLFDQVTTYGTLTSRLAGAQYIPNVYARSQNEWVNNFYKQNGYIEYDALSRLGIFDHKVYLKKQLLNEKYQFLDTCIVSQNLLDQVEANIEECIVSKSYIDLQTSLPSVLSDKDIAQILEIVVNNQIRSQTIIIDNYVVSKAFIDKLSKSCEDVMKENAKVVVESGKYQEYQISLHAFHSRLQKNEELEEKVDKRDERRKKAAGGKSGGGTQGRETKTKSTKKLYRTGNKTVDNEDTEEVPEKKSLQIVSPEHIKGAIEQDLAEEGLEELTNPIVNYLLPLLNDQALNIANTIYATTVTDRTANRRQTHNEIQNKINILLNNIRLFEKGLKLFPNEFQVQLMKYLLKSLCTDVVNEILNYVAAENNSNTVVDNFNNDQRLKFVNELPTEYKTPLTLLVKSLSGQNIDDFMAAVEESLMACSMIVKKIDKKKDRITILNHKHELLENLNSCDDLALALHLATLVIFTTATQCMVHASGRHVSGILNFLRNYLSAEQITELTTYHDNVALMLAGGDEATTAKENLIKSISSIKNIANEFKKPSSEKN